MEYNIKKTIAEIINRKEIGRSLEFKFHWEMCRKMRKVDKDVHFNSIRPLTREFLNFIDGNRTIKEIADAVGYEYGIRIKGEHVLMFLLPLKEKGYLTLKSK